MRRLSLTSVMLLAPALGVPWTSALPSDLSGASLPDPNRASALPVESLSDSPVVPAQVPSTPHSATAASPERALRANPLWAIPLASLTITRERPIFSPSRRPRPQAVAAAPVVNAPAAPPKPPPVERPQLSLVGTIAGGGNESFGIFLDQTTKTPLHLKLGQDYQGWRLRSVHGREVTLEHDQQSATLTLPQPGADASAQVQDPAENAVAQGEAAIPAPRKRR
jgi:hypothetical protein